VLSFLDFFQTSVQRTAVATAANMCRGLSSENVEAVAAAVPILTNLLQYEVCAMCQHCRTLGGFCCQWTPSNRGLTASLPVVLRVRRGSRDDVCRNAWCPSTGQAD